LSLDEPKVEVVLFMDDTQEENDIDTFPICREVTSSDL